MTADNDQYTDGWDDGYEAGLAVAKDERIRLFKALTDIARQPEGDEQSAQAVAREALGLSQ